MSSALLRVGDYGRVEAALRYLAAHSTVWAGVAQLVEHLICNQRVGGSNPFASSSYVQLRSRRSIFSDGAMYCDASKCGDFSSSPRSMVMMHYSDDGKLYLLIWHGQAVL